jgi:hypothetical protein
MLRLPHLQAVMIKFPFRNFHPVLVWFRVSVMSRFLFDSLCFLFFPLLPVPLFDLDLPRKLVGDATLGMFNIDLLLLLLLWHP